MFANWTKCLFTLLAVWAKEVVKIKINQLSKFQWDIFTGKGDCITSSQAPLVGNLWNLYLRNISINDSQEFWSYKMDSRIRILYHSSNTRDYFAKESSGHVVMPGYCVVKNFTGGYGRERSYNWVSLRASSPIWASEESLARTREQVAFPLPLAASPLARSRVLARLV